MGIPTRISDMGANPGSPAARGEAGAISVGSEQVMVFRAFGIVLLLLAAAVDLAQAAREEPRRAGTAAPVVRDFESGRLDGWVPQVVAPYSVTVVTDIVRRGRYAARFEVRQGDRPGSRGYRAELQDIYDAPAGAELWYGFSTYIPPEFPIQKNRCVIGQWWAPPDNKTEKDARRSPALAHRYENGIFRVTLRFSQEKTQSRNDGRQRVLLEVRNFPRGTWHDSVYRVRWSSGDDGIVEGWLDGTKVIDYRGSVGYNDRRAPYFKVGLYRDDVPETYVVHFDEYRRGHSYADVDPAAKR